MQIERKALYNLLRMKWLKEPSMEIEPWQTENYRELSQEQLLERLSALNIELDIPSFIAYADNCETPEELADCLVSDDQDVTKQDQVYLLVFELWRKLVPENLSLSIFCDELDHQIFLYDEEKADTEQLQNALANLETLLHQGTDEGGDPIEVFESVTTACAHDLESFLYDFIAEQIDEEAVSYASDLLDAFYDYVAEVEWFDFLRARVLGASDLAGANELIRQIVEDTSEDPDPELDLEILSFLVQGGEASLVVEVIKRCLVHLEVEADFQDLLSQCVDYFCCCDLDEPQKEVEELLIGRGSKDLESAVDQSDPDFATLLQIVERSRSPEI